MKEYIIKTEFDITSCQQCPLVIKHKNGSTTCSVKNGSERKYGTCLLTQLPPHGRLGDLDKAIKIIREASEFQKTRAMSGAFSRGIADGYDRVIKMLESTETVLEASKV